LITAGRKLYVRASRDGSSILYGLIVLSLLVVRAVHARSKFGAENLLAGRRDSKVGGPEAAEI
jgi:hypothetical protein